jgi:hypothetical protein
MSPDPSKAHHKGCVDVELRPPAICTETERALSPRAAADAIVHREQPSGKSVVVADVNDFFTPVKTVGADMMPSSSFT